VQQLFTWLKTKFAQPTTEPAPVPQRRDGASDLPVPYTIPVLVLQYLPTRQGRVDRQISGDVDAPLPQIRQHIAQTTQQVIAALESGSAYHRYKNPAAPPSLRYQIVETLEFLEPLPTWPKPGHRVPMTDYNSLLQRIHIADWVEHQGIKEVWIWGYHGGVIDLWESNMAGPWGDISNSDRDPHDLPLLSKTYTVYHYNYGRGASEAVEDHMHQIEALLRHVDNHLFWEKFVGKPGEGRCGWSHYPPNGVRDYDWRNPTPIWTDIEDWRPDGGGQKQLLNYDRWQGDSLRWFVYWMQNLPGYQNGLTYHNHPLTNWWHFVGDFDQAMAQGMKLVEPL
jgi:hypothetical protein